jgi:hypothetical protein
MQRLIPHSNSTKLNLNLLTLGELKRSVNKDPGNQAPSGWLLLYLAVVTGKKPSNLVKLTVSQTARLLALRRKRITRARQAGQQAGEVQFAR